MNKKELNLRPAFPAIPQDVYQALMGAAQSVREDPVRRHKPLKVALAAALLLVALMAAAYAAFPDQVARFFGRHYGADTQEWLKQGQVASPTDSLVFGGQTFTLEEVVYRNQGLYGLVRVRGNQAQTAEIYLNQVGVDGGPLMAPGVVGLGQEVQEDGSVLHSFEVADGLVIGQDQVFQLLFEVRVKGETREWLVAVEPLPQAEPEDAPGLPDSQAPGQREGSYDIILPEEYKMTGSLPVYRARLRDLGRESSLLCSTRAGLRSKVKTGWCFRTVQYWTGPRKPCFTRSIRAATKPLTRRRARNSPTSFHGPPWPRRLQNWPAWCRAAGPMPAIGRGRP